MSEIQLDGQTVAYKIIRTRRRKWSASLSVDREEGLVIQASPHMPEFLIRKFISDKSSWILKRLHSVSTLPSIEKHAYKSGETFQFFDRTYKLRLVETLEVKKPRLVVLKDTFFGMVHPESSQRQRAQGLRQEVIKWYMLNSVSIFKEKSEKYAQMLGMKFAKVSVKNMTSRWGSCTVDQRLSYNWKLALAPSEVCDYVVIHEISHLKHKHHQKSFWDHVSMFDIEYRLHRGWLKKNGHTLGL